MLKILNASIHTATTALPPTAIIGASVLFVVGLIVWLLGRKLVRPVCIVSGLILGGIAGLAIGKTLADQGSLVLPLVVGCAIAGALLAAVLFRLWIALAGAVVLAMVVPVASLVWQGGAPLQWAPQPATQPAATSPASAGVIAPGASVTSPAATEPTTRLLTGIWQAVTSFYQQQADAVEAWWNQSLDHSGRRMVYLGAAVGGLAGLVLGLLMPYIAASLESAVAGAILIFFAGGSLIRYFSPGHGVLVPSEPRAVIFTIGLITLAGFVFQWTIFRRSADR